MASAEHANHRAARLSGRQLEPKRASTTAVATALADVTPATPTASRRLPARRYAGPQSRRRSFAVPALIVPVRACSSRTRNDCARAESRPPPQARMDHNPAKGSGLPARPPQSARDAKRSAEQALGTAIQL